jgi:hypothetical protein
VNPVEELDVQPGISAVVCAPIGQTELDAAVLDLAAVLDGLVFDNFEIVVADVTPSRRVSDLLAELRVRFPHLPLRLLHGHYMDQTSALAAAFRIAAYDLIFVTSADGQYDIRELNHLLEAIEQGADLAIGYRLKRADGLMQRLDGWGWNLLVNLLFGPTARDVDCAFKLFRQTVWRHVDVHPHSPAPATFYTELLVRARRRGFRVTEVPVTHNRSAADACHDMASPAAIWRALFELQEMRRRVTRTQSAGEPAAGGPVPVRGRAA